MNQEPDNLEDLTDKLPDLVLMLGRDGTVLSFCGGRAVTSLPSLVGSKGRRLENIWPPSLVDLLKQLVHRAIAARRTVDARIQVAATRYEVRVTAQSPHRAICVIRPPVGEVDDGPAHPQLQLHAPYLNRRDFFVQFEDSLALATLSERPISLALIHIEGLVDISKLMDSTVAERILKLACQRYSIEPRDCQPELYMSLLGDNVLVVLLESADRTALERSLDGLIESLLKPVGLGNLTYNIHPYVGVATLGRDGSSQEELIQHARAAAVEARRADSSRIVFFSDTLELRSLTRVDMAHELREAIANGDVRLKYTGRYDLFTGRLLTLVGYVHWTHHLRGEMRPASFLSLAAATGLSLQLSRSVLECVRRDMTSLKSEFEGHVKLSYGPLRHHVLNDKFLDEVKTLLSDSAVSADRLELRIAERSYLAGSTQLWHSLADLDLQLVVDEVGRDMSSFAVLSRAPVWGLQLDRSWVAALNNDATAAKVCRAAMSVASAFDLIPIATGIDGPSQRDSLLALGCEQGMGDFYAATALSRPPNSRTKEALASRAGRQAARF